MKLNFWQWIGLVLLAIGLALWVYKQAGKGQANGTNTGTAPVVQPSR